MVIYNKKYVLIQKIVKKRFTNHKIIINFIEDTYYKWNKQNYNRLILRIKFSRNMYAESNRNITYKEILKYLRYEKNNKKNINSSFIMNSVQYIKYINSRIVRHNKFCILKNKNRNREFCSYCIKLQKNAIKLLGEKLKTVYNDEDRKIYFRLIKRL